MNVLLVPDAQLILGRYEAKRKARGLEFSPPPPKAGLGQFAFAEDVILTILLGVVTGVLTRAAAYLLAWPFQRGKATADAPQDVPAAPSPAALVSEIKASTNLVQQGIEKLRAQGVKTDEAQTAVDLLMESIQEVLEETATAKSSSTPS